MPLPDRVGLVQDALPCRGGAENVLEAVLDIFPSAPIHTLVHRPEAFIGTPLEGHDIRTSWLDRVPFARSRHRAFLPLYPWAIESLDVEEHEVVISFSYATAHGVVARPDQLHLAYTYTPLRQAWHGRREFRDSLGRVSRLGADAVFHYLRAWDAAAASRVDRFVALSHWIARCIRRAYGRTAEVIHPPVDVDAFEPLSPREDYYIAVSRLAPHKRLDILIEAFRGLPQPLLVVGEGALRGRLESRAPPNVRFLGRCPRDQLRELLGRARGFVHAAEEDFGIALVEAQAAGCPVVAYGGGGAAEIVVSGKTGILFAERTPKAAARAIQRLESIRCRLDPEQMVRNAERFSRTRFQRELSDLVEREWEAFGSRDPERPERRTPRDPEAA